MKTVAIRIQDFETIRTEDVFYIDKTDFLRSMFNSTFKTNPYLERAVMTGITQVSKESIFSDLNNLNV